MKNSIRLLLVFIVSVFSWGNIHAQCGATAVFADPQPIIICEGTPDVVTFTASGTCSGTYEFEVLEGATVVQPWGTASTFNASPAVTTIYTVNARCSACPGTVVSETFQVDVIEEPLVTGNVAICAGGTVPLDATGSTNIEWWDAPVGGNQMSANGTFTTPPLSTTTDYYVTASATIGGAGGSILITECGTDGFPGSSSADYIEISNLYTTPVNTTGWVVAVSSSYSVLNSTNSTYWYLPNSFAPCSIMSMTDVSSAPNYWGNNIFWNPTATANSWAIIIDDVGNVVDFIAWGWTAAQLASFNTTINGFNITLGPEWIGDGCATPCVPPGAGAPFSYSRTGGTDTNTNGDFTCQATSLDALNPGLPCGWTAGLTCPYPVTVTVNPNMDAAITAVGPYCETDLPVTLAAVDPGGTWSGTGITDPALGVFDPSIAGVGTHTITYTITGPCGDVQTTDIVVSASVDATITQVGPFCNVDPAVTLVAVSPGGTWSGNGITNAATGDFDPSTAGAGTHTITYTITGGCSDVQTIDIIVNATFDATITPAGPFCENDPSVVLTAVDPGGTWSGNGITNAATGDFDPATAGDGTHTITYSIPGACGDVQTLDVLVNTVDDATITSVGPFCLGAPTETMVGVTSGGTWSGTGITNAATGTFNATTAGPGVHTITYATNGPCPDVSTTTIQVYQPLTVQAFSDQTICDGITVDLSAQGSGGDGNLSFTWMDQTGAVVGTGANISVAPSTTTTYTVVLIDGCTTPPVSASVVITVNPVPEINFAADVVAGCAPLEVTFTNLSTPLGTECAWSFGDGESSTECGTATNIYEVDGCMDVTLTVTADGCTNTATIDNMICISNQTVAQFIVTPNEVDIWDPTFQFTNISLNAHTYFWDFGDSTTSQEIDPSHVYEAVVAGYSVCLHASNDYCMDSICSPVNVIDEPLYYVPNSFTPDGDEYNQSFNPIFTSGFDPYDFNFLIFNRWGEVIWESNDASVGWDGTYKGEVVAAGSYVWKVEFKTSQNDKRVMDSGHVNVLK
jgi:gliding motility-associated-like protein